MSPVVHDVEPARITGELPGDLRERLQTAIALGVARALERVRLDGPAKVPSASRPTAVERFDPARADEDAGVYMLPSYDDEGRLTGAELLRRLVPTTPRGIAVYTGSSPVEGGLIALLEAGHSTRYVNLRAQRYVSAGTLTEALVLGHILFPDASFGVVQGPVGTKHQRYLALATEPVVADADLGDPAEPAEPLDPDLQGKVKGVKGEQILGTLPGQGGGEYLIRALVTKDGVPHWRNAAIAALWFSQLSAEADRGITDIDPEEARVAIFDEIDALVEVAETGNDEAAERAAVLLALLAREAFALVDWETKIRYVRVLLRATTWDAQEHAVVEILASLTTPTELDAVAGLLREGGFLERMLGELTHRRYELLTLVGRRFGHRLGGLTFSELVVLLTDLGVIRPSLAALVRIGPAGELQFTPDALLAEAEAAVEAVEGFVRGLLETLDTILTEPLDTLKGLASLAQLAVTVTLAQYGYPPALRQIRDLLVAFASSVLDGARGAERLGTGEQVVRQLRWRIGLEIASMVVGAGEIKAVAGAVGTGAVGGKLAGVLRILGLLGRAAEGAAAERTILQMTRLAQIMRAERAAFGSAEEITQLIAHLPKGDVQDLVRLVGRVDVREGETLAEIGARSTELHGAVQDIMARAEVLKELAGKAGGLGDDVARGFASLVGRQGVEVPAAARIVKALPEGEGARFLAMLERTPMRGTNALARTELLEYVAASPARMNALGEFGTDLFRAVVRDAGQEAGQIDRTLETLRRLQARFAAERRSADFERLAQRLRRGDEGAWRVVDDAQEAASGSLRTQIEADLAAFQQRATGVSTDEQVLTELGLGPRDRIVGKPVENFELGNFAHDNAELLIPESELPRGLIKEYEIRLKDGSIRRIDRLDPEGGWVYEIKPDRPEWREAGQRQAQLYADWLNVERPLGNGRKWKPKVVYYDAKRLRQAFRTVGDLSRWMKP
ncbi:MULTISPECIES: hypothetical protein [Pseudarthrobacter]|uniref:hypothetical protein n=1 Tax=Pseudarthrobacter TaxID=1742993 RepID=UPI0013D96A08|nr:MULTISPECIES: hypothetical protein [Pseudarthrobacter]MDQ0000088.1 hypothetical protein [Pseudarthrobacter sulfonivorans]